MELLDYKLKYYNEVKSREIKWLWYPYIPLGKITIVQGDPGDGKTTFVLSLLSIISNGENLPCCDKKIFGNSIYQNTEDDNEDTIKPRLEKHGADCSKVCYIDKKTGSVSLDDGELEKAVIEANAKVLVLDPIQSFIGENIDMNRANAVRPRMNKLKELAEKTGCAVILVGHLNKNSGGKVNYRGLGSIDFSAAARSVLVVGKTSNDPSLRVVAQQKNNLAPLGDSLAFTLENGKVEWLGKYDITASDLLSFSGVPRETPKQIAASALLNEILEDGELSFKTIIKKASENNISKRTLMEAKASLNIQSIKRSDGWYWRKGE